MSQVGYDRAIVRVFANELYFRARLLVPLAAFLGGVFGAGVGAVTTYGWLGGYFGFLCCCPLGYLIGQDRAFKWKLQAQLALCQLEIEESLGVAAASALRPRPPPAVPLRPSSANAAAWSKERDVELRVVSERAAAPREARVAERSSGAVLSKERDADLRRVSDPVHAPEHVAAPPEALLVAERSAQVASSPPAAS